MESMRGQGGIQMLLTAEQEAQQIVTDARNLKLKRLKQAKEEAEREAAQFRCHTESDYQKKLSESTGSSGTTVKRLEEETGVKIKNLKQVSSKTSPEVVRMLIKYITAVKN